MREAVFLGCTGLPYILFLSPLTVFLPAISASFNRRLKSRLRATSPTHEVTSSNGAGDRFGQIELGGLIPPTTREMYGSCDPSAIHESDGSSDGSDESPDSVLDDDVFWAFHVS